MSESKQILDEVDGKKFQLIIVTTEEDMLKNYCLKCVGFADDDLCVKLSSKCRVVSKSSYWEKF